MFEFEKVCKKVEKMHPYTYAALVSETSARVIASLKGITKNNLSGMTIYNGLVLGAVGSDGKLKEEEFLLVKPMLDSAFGEKVSYKDAKNVVKYFVRGSRDYNEFAKAVVDLFGEISDTLKTDIVTVCLLVCGVDGKISSREKKWLRELIG